jgi:hypothetical protein
VRRTTFPERPDATFAGYTPWLGIGQGRPRTSRSGTYSVIGVHVTSRRSMLSVSPPARTVSLGGPLPAAVRTTTRVTHGVEPVLISVERGAVFGQQPGPQQRSPLALVALQPVPARAGEMSCLVERRVGG